MPDTEIMAEMGRFNEELVKAGILLAADGLRPSSHGKRVHFS
ncbi:YciI family protein, partial [Bacillus subtilis]|nr:YciI family protein [Bacillus subtilis]